MKKNRAFGLLGIAGVGVCVILLVVAIMLFEDGAYSPLGCFVSELGLYTAGYFTMSSALFYNIGTILAGAAIAVFMVYYGISKDTWTDAAFSFFGMLTGVLLIAQGVYTLNYAHYHIYGLIALFFSVFAMCAIYIVTRFVGSGIQNASLATLIVAFFAGCTSIAFAIFTLTGGVTQVFAEDAAEVGRLAVMPFAIIEWAALLLMFAFIVLLAVRMLPKTKRAAQSNDFGLRDIAF